MHVEKIQAQLLNSGVDDWVPLTEVTGLLQLSGVGSHADRAHQAVQVIRSLVESGLARVGKVSDGGFFAFEDPLPEVVRKIELSLATEAEEEWGWKYWLENTPRGDDLARKRVTSERHDG